MSSRSSGRVSIAVLVVAAMSIGLAAALADGFRNPPEGAAALGRAGTRLTQGDDGSAVVHNPANMLDLPGVSVMPSLTVGYGVKKYTDASDATVETRKPWHMMPSAFAALTRGDVAVGVGVHSPFGQANEWPERGIQQPYYSGVQSINTCPTVAVRLGKRVLVGAGVDILWSELELRQSIPNPAVPGDAFRMTLKGDGYGFGGNVGVTWLVTDRQRLSATYRTPISVDCDGSFALNQPLPLPPPMASMLSSGGDFTSELDFPAVAAAGYGIRVLDNLRVEANVEWVQHSRNKQATVDIGGNNPLLHLDKLMAPAPAVDTSPLVVPQDWEDTWTFSAGADWDVCPNWTLRAGSAWLPTPMPSETLSSSTAEGDQLILSVGLGFHNAQHKLDVAYAPAFAKDRTDAAGGTYEFTSQLMSASYAFTF